MSFNIKPVDGFKRDFKKLAKKYKKIEEDIRNLILELKENPKAGVPLQHNCYKIRVVNSSIPTGKSAGFRVIYYFIDEKNDLYLMSIYSKSKKDNISDNELITLLKSNHLV